MEPKQAHGRSIQRRGTKGNGATKGAEISLLSDIIDLMTAKKVASLKNGTIEIVLSPMAFQESFSVTTDGNNAENIDDLLYIKKPKNGFPTI